MLTPNDKKLIKAAEAGNLDELNQALAAGANPASDDNYAIGSASNNGHTKVVKLLIKDLRVNPAANNNYAIRWAAYCGHTEVARLLLKDFRADPTVNNNFPVKWAAFFGHTEVVKLLLKDQRVNPANDDGCAAIKGAAFFGHTYMVHILADWYKTNAIPIPRTPSTNQILKKRQEANNTATFVAYALSKTVKRFGLDITANIAGFLAASTSEDVVSVERAVARVIAPKLR